MSHISVSWSEGSASFLLALSIQIELLSFKEVCICYPPPYMHLVTLPDSLAPELPSLSVAAFEDVPFINFLRPKHREYPEYLRQHVAWKIRLKRNQPRNVIKVCLSDDSDEWWDEEVGAELLGYAVWDRRGKMDPKDGGIWGNDSLSKSTFLCIA